MKILVINHGLSHLRGCLVNTKTWEIDNYLSVKVDGFSGYAPNYTSWQSIDSLCEGLHLIYEKMPADTWDYFTVTSSAYNLAGLESNKLTLVGDQTCWHDMKSGEKPCDYAPRLRPYNWIQVYDSNSYIAAQFAGRVCQATRTPFNQDDYRFTDPFNFVKFGNLPIEKLPRSVPIGYIYGRYIISTYDALTVPFSFPGNDYLAYSAGTCASVRSKSFSELSEYNIPNVALTGASNNADGALIGWLANLFGLTLPEVDALTKPIWSAGYPTWVVNNNFAGSRTPPVKFGSGVIEGLSILTNASDIINAVSYGLSQDITRLVWDFPGKPCLVSGGTANQKNLNKLKSMITERDFYICKEKEMTAIGAAAMAIGETPKFPEIEEIIEWKKL